MAEEKNTPLLEWLIAALGLILVLGAVGFLLYQALAVEKAPPDIVMRVDRVVAAQDGYLVTVLVLNRGGKTAANLLVEGSLKGGETSETTIDYLPPRSQREAGLFFKEDPQGRELELRAKGYREP